MKKYKIILKDWPSPYSKDDLSFVPSHKHLLLCGTQFRLCMWILLVFHGHSDNTGIGNSVKYFQRL